MSASMQGSGNVYSTGAVCLVYIAVSGSMLNFNKYIVDPRRFPHPLMLTTCHMLMSLVLSCLCYLLRPSMYPGMAATLGRRLQVYKALVPIGVLFAVTLWCSNTALLYCSVPFLQFMKEANVVLVFLFSCMAGLQTLNRQRVVLIAWVILGSSFCVTGELHFVRIGFLVQALSQLAECARAVLMEMVMKGDFQIDPFSYTLLLSPVCLVVLGFGSAFTWTPAIWTDLLAWWPYILGNACLAFVLNIAIAEVMVQTSAVGFVITGVVKDICLVAVAAIAFQTEVTHKQCLAFSITLSGVFFWSLMKVAPEHSLFQRFEQLLGVPRKPLMAQDHQVMVCASQGAKAEGLGPVSYKSV